MSFSNFVYFGSPPVSFLLKKWTGFWVEAIKSTTLTSISNTAKYTLVVSPVFGLTKRGSRWRYFFDFVEGYFTF